MGEIDKKKHINEFKKGQMTEYSYIALSDLVVIGLEKETGAKTFFLYPFIAFHPKAPKMTFLITSPS